jgi:DNA-directed RNA polymerase subunit N (RpoN/RPB10)
MYNFLRCPCCNNSIGEFYELYVLIKNDMYEKEIKKNNISIPNQIQTSNDINMDLTELFELFNIENYCCRAKLTTATMFSSQIYNNRY